MAFTLYRAILICASQLGDLRPYRGSPEHELLKALYPALRKYEDARGGGCVNAQGD
jgi:hypothetical protein